VAFFAGGLVLGFMSAWSGPLGLMLAALVFGTVVVQLLQFPERCGAYLLGVSVAPLILLGSIVSRMPACDIGHSTTGECYGPITGPAMIGYAVIGVVGAVILAVSARRQP
jgi:hypothetical protein